MKLMADKLVNQLSVVRHWLGKLLRSLKLPQPQKLKVSFVLSFCKRLFYYFRIWILMSKNSFMTVLSRKKILFLFLLGKILRFSFFTAFIYFLVLGAKGLSGYTKEQVVFFFLTFSLIDILSQFLFREVYRFRSLVVTGDLDLVLTKPVSTLFRVLMGGADVIDFITIPPLLFAVCYVGNLFQPSYLQIFLYILLFFDGFLVALAFHIAVLALGILTLEIDHSIMIYRDLVALGKLPIDIYREPLRGILTFIFPVAIMVSLPAKALMGLVSLQGVFLSLTSAVLTFFVSLRFWNFALKKYTSAS